MVNHPYSQAVYRYPRKMLVSSPVLLPDKLSNLDLRSLPTFLCAKFVTYNEQPALIDAASGETITYLQLRRHVQKLAAVLKQKALGRPGSCVGLVSENSSYFPIVQLALSLAGYIPVLLNYSYTPDEFGHGITSTGTVAVIVSRSYTDVIHVCVSKMGLALKVLPFDDLISALQQTSGSQLDMEISGNSINEPCQPGLVGTFAIQFSSGTTGLPKPVLVTHKAFLSDILQISVNGCLEPCPFPSRILICCPMHHAYASIVTMYALYNGAGVVVTERFNAGSFWSVVERHKITHAHLVPPMAFRLLQQHQSSEHGKQSTLKSAVISAAPISPRTLQEFKETFSLEDCRQLHGMTEIGIAFVNTYGTTKYGSIGFPIPGAVGKVIHLDSGVPLGPKQEGEICYKGPSVHNGYYNNPTATQELIDQDGWVHTGDLGYFDDTGLFYVTGRIKEIMKYNGSQISPLELEHVLMQHPAVRDCAVVGKPDKVAGDLPAALVVLKSPNLVSAAELVQHLQGKVAPFKYLRGGVYFADEIPRGASGKTLRRQIVKRLFSNSKL